MNIKWLGNSTFLIKTSLSKKILIDPFSPLKILDTDGNVDIVTISKDFHNISGYNLSNSCNKLIFNEDSYTDDSIKIKSYLSFSDKLLGLKRGKNYIYTYEVDNLKLCHLGYIGDIPNSELINTLKGIDILFIPIGGNLCLNGAEAYKLINLLNPKYIIPMCYKCNDSDFYFHGPLEYISKSKSIFNANSNNINTNDLPTNTPLTILLKY